MTTEAMPMTGSQASLYQQLRGHLATLKLTAAAEHLPAVLAQAEAAAWSMTATLEHLLAREVEATEARKLAGRLRFASLPDTGHAGRLRLRRRTRRRQEARRRAGDLPLLGVRDQRAPDRPARRGEDTPGGRARPRRS